MTKGLMAAGITTAVGVLLAVVGLVVMSDVNNARSSQIIPHRVLLSSQDRSSVGNVKLEGRLEGELGKFIEVKHSECAVNLPFCSEGPCTVLHIRSEDFVHDQDDFAKVQIPMFISAGMDMKKAKVHMNKFGVDVGDLQATCEMTYVYKRFTYFMMTVTHEWSLREMANKVLNVDPNTEDIDHGKQSDEKVMNMVRFGFERKNMSFDKSGVKKGYFSGVMLGDAQIHIAPGKVADAVADFLGRVKVEVSADVRYTDSSSKSIDGKASVAGPCSHKVHPRGGVQVQLPIKARGRVHMLSLIPALAKAYQEPQFAIEDGLNQASHEHSFELVNEPRSFVGDLIGVSHKVSSNGVLNAEGVRVRDLQRMLREDRGRLLQTVMTTQTKSIVFQERLYFGDSTVNVSGILKENGGPLKGQLTIGIGEESDSERSFFILNGSLAGAQSFIYDYATKNWDIGMRMYSDEFELGTYKACDLTGGGATITMAYVDATKTLSGSIVITDASRAGTQTRSYCGGGAHVVHTDTTTITVGATFQNSFPAWPATASIQVKGTGQVGTATPTTQIPQTTVQYAFSETGTIDSHTFSCEMQASTSTVSVGKLLPPTSGNTSDLSASVTGSAQTTFGRYFQIYDSLPDVNVQSSMSMSLPISIDKSSTTAWAISGSVTMNMACAVVNDAALQSAATQATTNFGSTIGAAVTATAASSDPRKYDCGDDDLPGVRRDTCTNASSSFNCCLSHVESVDNVFKDSTACDVFMIGMMDGLGMDFGSSSTSFTASMDPITTTSEENGHFKMSLEGSSLEITAKDFNDVVAQLVVEDTLTGKLAITNNWATCASNNCTQAVSFDLLDDAGDPDFKVRVDQWNTKGVVYFGPNNNAPDGKIGLLGTAAAPGLAVVRVVGTSYSVPDGSAGGAAKVAEEMFRTHAQATMIEEASNSIVGEMTLDTGGTARIRGDLSITGATATYVLAASITDVEQEPDKVVARADSTMTRDAAALKYAGDVVLKIEDEEDPSGFFTESIHVELSNGFKPPAVGADSDEVWTKIALGRNGAGYEDFGGHVRLYAKRGSAPVRDFAGFGMSVEGHEKNTAGQAKPLVEVGLHITVPYEYQVQAGSVAKVTSFTGKFKMSAQAITKQTFLADYKQSIADAANIPVSQVAATVKAILVKAKITFPPTAGGAEVTVAQCPQIVAKAANVLASQVICTAVTTSRRLNSNEGRHGRRLAQSFNTEITQPADASQTQLESIVAATSDPATITTASTDSGIALSGSVTVVEAPSTQVQVTTEMTSTAGAPAIETPSTAALDQTLSQNLGEEVTTEEIVVNPTTESTAFVASSQSTFLHSLAVFVCGAAILSAFQG